MAFKTITDLSADTTISLGGTNRKTGKKNPTSVEGYYLGSRQVKDKKKKDGLSNIYFFQTSSGNIGVWGKTDLDRKMSSVTTGTMTRASFDKMVPTPNGEMYKFKVEVDDSNTIVVAGSNQSVAVSSSSYNDDSGPELDEDDEIDSYENEETTQKAALSVAERKAKVASLLGTKNR